MQFVHDSDLPSPRKHAQPEPVAFVYRAPVKPVVPPPARISVPPTPTPARETATDNTDAAVFVNAVLQVSHAYEKHPDVVTAKRKTRSFKALPPNLKIVGL